MLVGFWQTENRDNLVNILMFCFSDETFMHVETEACKQGKQEFHFIKLDGKVWGRWMPFLLFGLLVDILHQSMNSKIVKLAL